MNYRQFFSINLVLGILLSFQTVIVLQSATLPEGVKLRKRQNLRVYLEHEPHSLDPHHYNDSSEDWVIRDLFEGLTRFDEQGQVLPGTASHWEHDESFTTWTFYLRENARWSNNASVLADDFVYSWRRLATNGVHAENLESKLHLKYARAVRDGTVPPGQLGVEATDEKTLKLHLDYPVPDLPKLLCAMQFSPLYRYTLVQQNQDPQHAEALMVTNGPYWTPWRFGRSRLRIVQNRYYWDNANTCVQQVDYFFNEWAPLKFLRFWLGMVDIAPVVADRHTYEQLTQRYPTTVQTLPSFSWQGIMLNATDPVLKNPALRKALNLVIDRQALLNLTRNQGDQPTYGFLPPSCDPLLPAWTQLPYQERCDQARALIKEVERRDGVLPTLELAYRDDKTYRSICEALVSTWKSELKIKVILKPRPFTELRHALRAGKYQMSASGFLLSDDDAVSILNQFQAGGVDNEPRYDSEVYQALLEQAMKQTSAAERLRYCQQANLLLAEDAPCIPLCFMARQYLIHPRLGGWTHQTPFLRFYAKDLYLKQ